MYMLKDTKTNERTHQSIYKQ